MPESRSECQERQGSAGACKNRAAATGQAVVWAATVLLTPILSHPHHSCIRDAQMLGMDTLKACKGGGRGWRAGCARCGGGRAAAAARRRQQRRRCDSSTTAACTLADQPVAVATCKLLDAAWFSRMLEARRMHTMSLAADQLKAAAAGARDGRRCERRPCRDCSLFVGRRAAGLRERLSAADPQREARGQPVGKSRLAGKQRVLLKRCR